MKYQDWQRDSRDESLSAESDDAPAWLREHPSARTTPLHRLANLFGVLALFALSVYLLAEHSEFGDLFKAKIHGIASAIALPSIALNAPPPRQAADPYPIAQHVEPIQPDTLASETASNPQPLADCIKSANLIDENVVACRYGTLPRDHRPARSNGMVSAQYLAQYKADQANQANRSSAPAQGSANRE